MVYNTKNSKKFLQIKTLVLPLLFFVTTAKAYIFKVDLLVNKETGQEITCLSDWHKYPDHWKRTTENENIASVQQANIITFAKELKATVLIESLPNEVYFLESLSEKTNEKMKKLIFQGLINTSDNSKSETPLDLLYSHCVVNNIRCENVECRVTPKCFDWNTGTFRLGTLQEILDMAQKTAKKIAQFNDEEPFKKIYKEELYYFNRRLYPNLERLVKKLSKYSNMPINELAVSIKNQQITLPNSINDPPIIANLIEKAGAFPIKFVDMNILHAIAQNKQTPTIIVTAGGDHIRHVVQRLQQCGYAVKESIGQDLIYPSTLDLKTVFNNLEQAKSNHCVQKIKNFFRHPWTKRIGCLALAAAGVYAVTHWLSK